MKQRILRAVIVFIVMLFALALLTALSSDSFPKWQNFFITSLIIGIGVAVYSLLDYDAENSGKIAPLEKRMKILSRKLNETQDIILEINSTVGEIEDNQKESFEKLSEEIEGNKDEVQNYLEDLVESINKNDECFIQNFNTVFGILQEKFPEAFDPNAAGQPEHRPIIGFHQGRQLRQLEDNQENVDEEFDDNEE